MCMHTLLGMPQIHLDIKLQSKLKTSVRGPYTSPWKRPLPNCDAPPCPQSTSIPPCQSHPSCILPSPSYTIYQVVFLSPHRAIKARMEKEKLQRFAKTYHLVVAVILLVTGGISFSLGIWLRATDNGGPNHLDYSAGSGQFNSASAAGSVGIGLGVFLLVMGSISLLASMRRCVGVTFRVIYIVLALGVAVVLGVICWGASAISFLTRQNDAKDSLETVWQTTVSTDVNGICAIEKEFDCRGFNDNDCVGCVGGEGKACKKPTNCAKCDKMNKKFGKGCGDEILKNMRSVFRPIAVITGLIALAVAVDIVMSCCIPVREGEQDVSDSAANAANAANAAQWGGPKTVGRGPAPSRTAGGVEW